MSININAKNDYSFMFSSLGSSAGSSNFLMDYASIKNGSYGKLMKAYYRSEQTSGSAGGSKTGSNNIIDKLLEEKRNPKVSKDVQEANAKLTSGLSSMKKSVSALQNDKTYTDTANGKSAVDKVTTAVKAYVSDYNDVVNAAKSSTLSHKTAYVVNVMSSTAANADKLAEIGIKVNSNGTLTSDESRLKTADGVTKAQELFSSKNIMSYGSVVASRLQFAGVTAATDTAADNKETESTAISGAAGLKADSKALASSSLFEKIEDKDGKEKYDIEKILSTAKSFVSNYNRMFDAAGSSSNSGVVANLSYIREKTARNEDALKEFGISVDRNGKMSINEDTFKKSDMSQVQKFFQDYGSSIATNASLVDYYMTTQANAANGYTSDGTYNVQGSARYADFV